jgi:hypothetical protein
MMVGWNVYIGSTPEDLKFSGFIPDEAALDVAARALADEVERHAAAGDMGGGREDTR